MHTVFCAKDQMHVIADMRLWHKQLFLAVGNKITEIYFALSGLRIVYSNHLPGPCRPG
jgi:hypothetical protein